MGIAKVELKRVQHMDGRWMWRGKVVSSTGEVLVETPKSQPSKRALRYRLREAAYAINHMDDTL